MKYAGTAFLDDGPRHLPDMGRRLLTIVEDRAAATTPSAAALQRRERRAALRRSRTHRAAGRSFLHALAPFGLGKKDIVANVTSS